MSILKSIIFGRPNGLRRTLFRRVSSYGHDDEEDTSPSSSYSAPVSEQGVVAGGTVKMEPPKGITLATANTCPHSGGPLVDGMLDGSILTCPYHGWGFDLKDGSCQTNPSFQLPIYPALVEGDGVCVQI